MGLLFGYWWLILPAIIFGWIAQSRVKSTYKEQRKVQSQKRVSGARMARWILDSNNLGHVQIERVKGELTDHYDPRSKVLRLSENVYNGTDVAALGIASHEAGHALQHAKAYAPIAVRNTVYPVASFGSNLGPILVIGGLFLGSIPLLINLGIVLFAFAVAFTVLTLPVEFDASGRALRILKKSGAMSDKEVAGARKVLSAAAMTYVASALASVLTLARLILLAQSE
jgi:Zn-dependent membrane protease YugP